MPPRVKLIDSLCCGGWLGELWVNEVQRAGGTPRSDEASGPVRKRHGRQGDNSQGAGAALTADSPAAIRNVVLVGPSGGGKTTLVEAPLAASGVLTRAGRGGRYDGLRQRRREIRQQRSVGLALAPLLHDGIKVNLIDTPGYADFVGELRAGLRPRIAPFSSSRPMRASMHRPSRCGWSAARSACRGPW